MDNRPPGSRAFRLCKVAFYSVCWSPLGFFILLCAVPRLGEYDVLSPHFNAVTWAMSAFPILGFALIVWGLRRRCSILGVAAWSVLDGLFLFWFWSGSRYLAAFER